MMPEIDGTPCASPRTTSAMPAANGPFTRSETRSHGDATFSHASMRERRHGGVVELRKSVDDAHFVVGESGSGAASTLAKRLSESDLRRWSAAWRRSAIW